MSKEQQAGQDNPPAVPPHGIVTVATVTNLQFQAVSAVNNRVLVPTLLFEAGAYPDRGVTITEADLDAVMARFNATGASVPIRVEHLETPLDPLGHVVALHREGRFLFGTLAFPAGIYAHIQERKATRVSVAFHVVEDELGKGYRLQETSLVFTPRVPNAGFLTSDQAAAHLAPFRAAGKVTPAMEGPLTRLLANPIVRFADDAAATSLLQEIDALLDAMPIVQPRGAGVPVPPFSQTPGNTPPTSPLTPEMTTWAQAMGLDPARIAQLKGDVH